MDFTRVNFTPAFFSDKEQLLLCHGALKATTLRYASGVCGVRIENGACSMVLLPYMGMQIWFAEFGGKNLTMKSIFDEPLATTNYGDNYGALLLHCGLTNLGCPPDGENYPLHGELPFAAYEDCYVGIGEDEGGVYLALGGTYRFRNSQEYNYLYRPELRLHLHSTMLEMHVNIENRRANPLDYMFMCHINWLAVDGSRLCYSAPRDKEHIDVYLTELSEDTPRAKRVLDWGKQLLEDPTRGDTLDSTTQCYDPEMCINYKYKADADGWAHAMQVMPEGDACCVRWRTAELPYALRWLCRTGDEDGIGIALPSTGNHLGTTYQKENGLYNTVPPHGSASLRFDFGYLCPDEAAKVEQHINSIIK